MCVYIYFFFCWSLINRGVLFFSLHLRSRTWINVYFRENGGSRVFPRKVVAFFWISGEIVGIANHPFTGNRRLFKEPSPAFADCKPLAKQWLFSKKHETSVVFVSPWQSCIPCIARTEPYLQLFQKPLKNGLTWHNFQSTRGSHDVGVKFC